MMPPASSPRLERCLQLTRWVADCHTAPHTHTHIHAHAHSLSALPASLTLSRSHFTRHRWAASCPPHAVSSSFRTERHPPQVCPLLAPHSSPTFPSFTPTDGSPMTLLLLLLVLLADDIVVYVAGAWDCFHPGHVAFLAEARKLGTFLLVGVHDDQVSDSSTRPLPHICQLSPPTCCSPCMLCVACCCLLLLLATACYCCLLLAAAACYCLLLLLAVVCCLLVVLSLLLLLSLFLRL